jgi:hypothetical protein
MAKFQANSTQSATTGLTPFEATKGHLPRAEYEPAALLQGPAPVKKELAKADRLVTRLERVHEFLRDNIAWAQAKQKEYADRRRLPAPQFRIGDKVWLDARNLRTTRPSRSLDYKNLADDDALPNQPQGPGPVAIDRVEDQVHERFAVAKVTTSAYDVDEEDKLTGERMLKYHVLWEG